MTDEVRSVQDRAGPAHVLVASALTGFLQAMDDNLPGVLTDADPEHLHDFRVGVRRTRTTLKLGRPALPEALSSRWEPEFRWLSELTAPVRDLDVLQGHLGALREQLVASDAADLAVVDQHLRRRRSDERQTLMDGLRSVRCARLRAGWGETLVELEAAPPDAWEGQLIAGDLADRSITRAAHRVVRGGSRLTADAPAIDLHRLRRRCRDLRYALAAFAPVLDRGPRKKAIADLKGLQRVLGRVQDTEVQRSALRAIADELAPEEASAGTALALGELIGLLDADQDRARADFDDAFARLTRTGSRRRLKRLGGKE
jgi:CHAD domain-containing protein